MLGDTQRPGGISRITMEPREVWDECPQHEKGGVAVYVSPFFKGLQILFKSYNLYCNDV